VVVVPVVIGRLLRDALPLPSPPSGGSSDFSSIWLYARSTSRADVAVAEARICMRPAAPTTGSKMNAATRSGPRARIAASSSAARISATVSAVAPAIGRVAGLNYCETRNP
jgi:hypothetical protein